MPNCLTGEKKLICSELVDNQLKLTFEVTLNNGSNHNYSNVSMKDHFHLHPNCNRDDPPCESVTNCSKCQHGHKLAPAQVELDNTGCATLAPYLAGPFVPPASGELLKPAESTIPGLTDCLLIATFWLDRDSLCCCDDLKNCLKLEMDCDDCCNKKRLCVCSDKFRLPETLAMARVGSQRAYLRTGSELDLVLSSGDAPIIDIPAIVASSTGGLAIGTLLDSFAPINVPQLHPEASTAFYAPVCGVYAIRYNVCWQSSAGNPSPDAGRLSALWTLQLSIGGYTIEDDVSLGTDQSCHTAHFTGRLNKGDAVFFQNAQNTGDNLGITFLLVEINLL